MRRPWKRSRRERATPFGGGPRAMKRTASEQPRWFRIIQVAAATWILAMGAFGAADTSLATYGRLLAKYVTPAGVCYDAWRATPEDVNALSQVVGEWSARDVGALAPAERKALFINLYNAKVLEIVLTNAPKDSIKEVTPGLTGFGVFREPVLTLAGKSISLTDLEDRLRGEFKDPRVHFAINCASRSCPPIAAEPYLGERIDVQLDRSAKAFLASPGAVAPEFTMTVPSPLS